MHDLIQSILHMDIIGVLGAVGDAVAAAASPDAAPAWYEFDKILMNWIKSVGNWSYLVMFSVIYAETGFVIFPFLPGDSFLIMIGVLCSNEGSGIHWYIVMPMLIAAAILGNFTNYTIGRALGPKIFRNEGGDSVMKRALSRDKLDAANRFFARHGGKAVTFAQFIPFLRCIVPFVAGMGQMERKRFITFNWIGAILWIGTFVSLGLLAGNWLEKHQSKLFMVMFIAVICIVLSPLVVYFVNKRKAAGAGVTRNTAISPQPAAAKTET